MEKQKSLIAELTLKGGPRNRNALGPIQNSFKEKYLDLIKEGVISTSVNESTKCVEIYAVNEPITEEELNKFAEVAKLEKAVMAGDKEQWELDQALNDIKLFNTVIGLDEAYEKMDKSRRTKFSLNMGHFIRKWRHYHNLFILCTPDADDIDRRMAWKRRTHEIHCYHDERDGICQYRIWWKRPDVTKVHELVPANWSHIWESHNVVPQATINIRRPKMEEDDAS